MSKKNIKGSEKLSKSIRERRKELGLTIEEAALRAGVGTKTWCRYEAGESIRQDKSKGVCKALNWHVFPEEDIQNATFDINKYKKSDAWSDFISECYGEAAAISFVIGSDILYDYIVDDMRELSALPKGTHIGQLELSMLKDILPEQFLMNYDYEFLYYLKLNLVRLRKSVNNKLVANTVLEELLFYLIVEESAFLMETMYSDMLSYGVKELEDWNSWIFEFFGDMDVVTTLYSDMYLTSDNMYHFNHWQTSQFYV